MVFTVVIQKFSEKNFLGEVEGSCLHVSYPDRFAQIRLLLKSHWNPLDSRESALSGSAWGGVFCLQPEEGGQIKGVYSSEGVKSWEILKNLKRGGQIIGVYSRGGEKILKYLIWTECLKMPKIRNIVGCGTINPVKIPSILGLSGSYFIYKVFDNQ